MNNAQPLNKSPTRDIVDVNTASAMQPQPSRYLLVYFQERRRALLTELKAVEEALKELKLNAQT